MNEHSDLVMLNESASSRMEKKAIARKGLIGEDIKQANERSKGLIGVGQDGRPMPDDVLYNAKRGGYKNTERVLRR